MSTPELRVTVIFFVLLAGIAYEVEGQVQLQIDSPGFRGAIHDNVSNKKRQGSGLNPLVLKTSSGMSLFRNDAVGLNFEHVFNGAKGQYDISMFTPRKDICHLKRLGDNKFELRWPAKESQWGLESRMEYDFSVKSQVDLIFECTPTKRLFSQNFVAMMWASYMNSARSRKIHFWGQDGNRVGWVSFGDGDGKKIEVGTVQHKDSVELTYEKGSQTLNLLSSPNKKFIAPFYYGLLDDDQNYETEDDPLLYMMLFDQTDSIRFAMWNFYSDKKGIPDTHSPAWDWQYVVRNPEIGKRYRYRARIVVKPFEGVKQVTDEYQKWQRELGLKLPTVPEK